MTITFDTSKIGSVLLAHAGWMLIEGGTLKIDTMEPTSPALMSGQNTYGFTCITSTGDRMTGRLSALLAVGQGPESE